MGKKNKQKVMSPATKSPVTNFTKSKIEKKKNLNAKISFSENKKKAIKNSSNDKSKSSPNSFQEEFSNQKKKIFVPKGMEQAKMIQMENHKSPSDLSKKKSRKRNRKGKMSQSPPTLEWSVDTSRVGSPTEKKASPSKVEDPSQKPLSKKARRRLKKMQSQEKGETSGVADYIPLTSPVVRPSGPTNMSNKNKKKKTSKVQLSNSSVNSPKSVAVQQTNTFKEKSIFSSASDDSDDSDDSDEEGNEFMSNNKTDNFQKQKNQHLNKSVKKQPTHADKDDDSEETDGDDSDKGDKDEEIDDDSNDSNEVDAINGSSAIEKVTPDDEDDEESDESENELPNNEVAKSSSKQQNKKNQSKIVSDSKDEDESDDSEEDEDIESSDDETKPMNNSNSQKKNNKNNKSNGTLVQEDSSEDEDESDVEGKDFINDEADEGEETSDEEDDDDDVAPNKKSKYSSGEGGMVRQDRLEGEHKVFVNNLPSNTTEEMLREALSEGGEVSSVAIPINKETGDCRGFAFVSLLNKESLQKTLELDRQATIDGQTLGIRIYTDDGGRRGGRGRGGGGRGWSPAGGRGFRGGSPGGRGRGFRGNRGEGGFRGQRGGGFRGGRGEFRGSREGGFSRGFTGGRGRGFNRGRGGFTKSE